MRQRVVEVEGKTLSYKKEEKLFQTTRSDLGIGEGEMPDKVIITNKDRGTQRAFKPTFVQHMRHGELQYLEYVCEKDEITLRIDNR